MLEDSNAGARAGLAAGMQVAMVPDLLQPEAELLARGIRVAASLREVASWLAPLLAHPGGRG